MIFQYFFDFIYMLIGMVLETLGVSLVIPVFTLLLESDVGSEYPFLRPLLSYLGDPSQITLIFYRMSFFLLVYFTKTLVSLGFSIILKS